MINTLDETRNHLRNPEWHESQNTQHRYSQAPTDIKTIVDSPIEIKGHIQNIQILISGNRGQVCVMKVSKRDGDSQEPFLKWSRRYLTVIKFGGIIFNAQC